MKLFRACFRISLRRGSRRKRSVGSCTHRAGAGAEARAPNRQCFEKACPHALWCVTRGRHAPTQELQQMSRSVPASLVDGLRYVIDVVTQRHVFEHPVRFNLKAGPDVFTPVGRPLWSRRCSATWWCTVPCRASSSALWGAVELVDRNIIVVHECSDKTCSLNIGFPAVHQ